MYSWHLGQKVTVALTVFAVVPACGPSSEASREPDAVVQTTSPAQTPETGEDSKVLWVGGPLRCTETVAEFQATQLFTGPSDDPRYSSQTSMNMDIVTDKERILALCGAIGDHMSRNEVLCPPELLDAFQAELRDASGKVIATAVHAQRFVDSTGKERAEELSIWISRTPSPVCYELTLVDSKRFDEILKAALD